MPKNKKNNNIKKKTKERPMQQMENSISIKHMMGVLIVVKIKMPVICFKVLEVCIKMNSKIHQMCPFLHLKRFKVPIPLLPEFLLSSLRALVVFSVVTIYPGIYVLINQKLGLMACKNN